MNDTNILIIEFFTTNKDKKRIVVKSDYKNTLEQKTD